MASRTIVPETMKLVKDVLKVCAMGDRWINRLDFQGVHLDYPLNLLYPVLTVLGYPEEDDDTSRDDISALWDKTVENLTDRELYRLDAEIEGYIQHVLAKVEELAQEGL